MIVTWIAGLIGLLIGTYTDLKTREVPDWLNFSLISLGIGINLIYSLVFWSYDYIFYSMVGFVFCLGLGFLMYYGGQWGGGDSKLIMGIGALIGLNPLTITLLNLPFVFQFVINLILVGAAYGFIWTGVIAIKNWKIFYPYFKKHIRMHHGFRVAAWCIAIFGVVFKLFFGGTLMVFLLCAAVFFMFYIWISVRVVERNCMIKKVNPSKLTEGDWIFKDVVVKGKTLVARQSLGLTLQQLEIIKKAKVPFVWIREGVPFVPSFLLSFLVTTLFPGWFMPF
ncbi:MAG: A24 family peptidase [Nanoarchaeota archaeon]|nr:A24 family peptidase [Nanoarchaeota archaeon]MBU1975301.1 A24 family peptidase [Nanoarchaeota archaeon]